MQCPCNAQKVFSECCGPILSGERNAETAEELMRSRYSAFVTANVDYLMRSHHSKTRPLKDRKNILAWTKSVKWIGLKIVNKTAGSKSDVEGWVAFQATYLDEGEIACIHENSFFKKEMGTWYYVSGDHQ